MSGKILLTASGAKRCIKELERLKSKERPQVIEDIATARSHGDLKENSEYTAAKEKQRLVENNIAELENIVFNHEIFDPSMISNKNEIRFGAICELENENKIVKYQIVSSVEADYANGLIGIISPFGKALLGKKIGDVAELITANGEKKLFIVRSIKYE